VSTTDGELEMNIIWRITELHDF